MYFDKRIPNIYDGDLTDSEAIVSWLTEQAKGSHIEEVSDELLSKLIKDHDDVTVFFYDKNVKQVMRFWDFFKNPVSLFFFQEIKLLEELENVDHILEERGIPLVKMDNEAEAEKHQVDVSWTFAHHNCNDYL